MAINWITEDVAIGSRLDAHDSGVRAQSGLRSVVSLDGSMTDDAALALGYEDCVCVSMLDGPGNSVDRYRDVVRSLIDMAQGSPTVLVHCHAGRSRSVAVVAGYLVATQGCSPEAALDFIATLRDTAVQPGLLELVRTVAQK